jgi:TRAP-type C4-dicarboxylate transport system substrate-binding protein
MARRKREMKVRIVMRPVGKVLLAVCLALLSAGLALAGGQKEPAPGGAAAGEAPRKTIRLRMTAGHPYAAAAWVQILEDFYIPEIEKRVLERTTGYQLECKGFYGGSLAKLGEELETVESGTADVAIVNNIFEQAKLEIHNFNWWAPFTSPDLRQVLAANAKVMDEFPVFDEVFARYNQRHLGRSFNCLLSVELITNFPIKTLEDLKGKKIAHGGSMIPWLKALGAVGVQSAFSDAYTSIDTGVYQGWAMPADVAMTFKVHEVAKYFTEVGFGSFVSGYLTINLDTWNSLPKEVQVILDEVGYEYSQELYKKLKANEAKALDAFRAAGCTIYKISDQERARWGKVLSDAGVAREAARKADADGYPGTAVLKAYIKALEDGGYTFPFRPNL